MGVSPIFFLPRAFCAADTAALGSGCVDTGTPARTVEAGIVRRPMRGAQI